MIQDRYWHQGKWLGLSMRFILLFDRDKDVGVMGMRSEVFTLNNIVKHA